MLYTVQFRKLIRQGSALMDPAVKKTLVGLVVWQIFALGRDTSMAILLFSDYYLARQLHMPLNYALKVLMEFFVLNELITYSSSNARIGGEVLLVENVLMGEKREDSETGRSS